MSSEGTSRRVWCDCVSLPHAFGPSHPVVSVFGSMEPTSSTSYHADPHPTATACRVGIAMAGRAEVMVLRTKATGSPGKARPVPEGALNT